MENALEYYKARIVSIKEKNGILSLKVCIFPKTNQKYNGYTTLYLNKNDYTDPMNLDGKKIEVIKVNNKWRIK